MDTESQDYARAREEARRQARALRAFYLHALVYGAVMAMLVAINFASGDAWEGNWWVQWPAMSWGVLLIIHGIFATKGSTLFGPEWEERKIEELMNKRGKPGS